MATAEEYAAWIVKNADKQGTPEFDTVARAYQSVRGQTSAKTEDGMPSERAAAPETPQEPAARLPKRGGFAKQVGEALYTPAETPRIPTAEELLGRYKQLGIGTLKGVPAGVVGLPGDIESLVHKNTFLPTSHGVGDYMFGPAATKDEQTGRTIGTVLAGFGGPATATRIIAPLREAAQAAELAKTAQALRATQFALDPLAPIVSGAVTVGAKGYNALRNTVNYAVSKDLTAANRLAAMTNDPEAALAAMRHAEGVPTSGGPMSVNEMLAAGNVAEPRVAAAQAALEKGATAPLAQQAQQERVAAIQSNLGNVENQLRLATREITPEMRGDPAMVQAALEQQVAAEEARLQAAGGRITGQIPNPSQQAVGQALTQTAATAARETAANVVQPAYAAVIREAGDVPINLERPLAAAQAVRGSATGIMDASTVPQGIRALENFRAAPLPGEAIAPAFPGLPGRTGTPIPQPSTVTPAEFMNVRAELARDLRDAQGANNFPAVRHMREILAEMDTAFAQSGVTPRTLELYADAGRLHGTETVARSRTGETAQMLQQGANNRPQLLPENVAAAFLKGETPAEQFVTTFRNDPAAAAQMGQGVGGLFRDAVIGADGLVDAQKASAFVRDHRRQLDILENSGVRITDQLASITEQAATNARQRQAFAERSAGLRGAPDAETVVNTALGSTPQMEFLLRQLNADQRAGLVANIKNRALDSIKAGDADAAIKFLTDHQGTIQQAIGRNGQTEHTLLLNAARVQKRLEGLQGTVPNAGIYDPKVLAAKFSPSQLADLNIAAQDIARLKQVEEVAQTGVKAGGTGVAPSPAKWGELLMGTNSINPLVWAKVLGGKIIKNAMDARITAEAFNAMYRDPQRYAAALDRAIKQKKTIENIRGATKEAANSLVTRPTISGANALADQQGRR